jgi:hypothetical protein
LAEENYEPATYIGLHVFKKEREYNRRIIGWFRYVQYDYFGETSASVGLIESLLNWKVFRAWNVVDIPPEYVLV